MDIGGTFTDVVSYDASTHTFSAGKALSTPGNLSQGVFDALASVDIAAPDIEYFVHGTTQGLNALLERRGSRILLATTKGMGDIYQIARGNRDRLFDLHYKKPTPLVPRRNTMEVRGRYSSAGEELEKLSVEDVKAVAKRAKEDGFTSVVVSLLYSYLDPSHEIEAGRILREQLGDDVLVVLSHEVASEWREYERTSSAVLEGYTGPSVHRYLEQVEDEFASQGMQVPVHIMQSSGGLVRADFAKRHTLQTLLSGPVGGTMGGVAVSRLIQAPNIICADMGGTSFDVSLVINGEPDVSPDGQVEGFPLLIPMANLHTVGAGGGSIAYTTGAGLRVGPQSAGAVPGPAAYGNGGTEATVTDANTVLGRVNPITFAGGQMTLDVSAARRVVGQLADSLDLDIIQMAEGICDVSNSHMARAIRTLTVDHGLEPNDFTLLAFGGAGPMHAAFIAKEIGIRRVVIPKFPGAFSAWGMLEADVRRDFAQQFFATRETLDQSDMQKTVDSMSERAREALMVQDMTEDRITIEHSVDMRYESQDYTLTIPLSDLDITAEDFPERIESRFSEAHERRYGHSTPGAPVQYVTLRTVGVGSVTRARDALTQRPAGNPIIDQIPVYFGGEETTTPLYDRDLLKPGDAFEGPAIIIEPTTTTVVPPHVTAEIDDHEFILLHIAPSGKEPRP